MSVNLYNKAYASMKETLPQFKNPEEAISFYLEGGSKYLAKAAKAAEENRIEDRSNLSDKALLIFSGILSHLEQASAEEKKALKPFIEYCYSMNELILHMNMKNDVEMAHSLAAEVKRMAEDWKGKAQENFSKKQQETSLRSPEKTNITSLPSDGSSTPFYPAANDLSTADFSA
tara:strand:+ start:918 stop:1439 length:522 start_codon:yes stop_codon:yes gene_type:complete